MSRLWICLALLAFVFVTSKAQENAEDSPEYWFRDYEDGDSYDDDRFNLEENNDKDDSNQLAVKTFDESDENNAASEDRSDDVKNVEEEIEMFRKRIENLNEDDNKESFDALEDYQIEDNRSDPKEQLNSSNEKQDDSSFEGEAVKDVEDTIGKSNELVAPEILEETKALLEEDDSANESTEQIEEVADIPSNIDDVIDETNKLIEEIDSGLVSKEETENKDIEGLENSENNSLLEDLADQRVPDLEISDPEKTIDEEAVEYKHEEDYKKEDGVLYADLSEESFDDLLRERNDDTNNEEIAANKDTLKEQHVVDKVDEDTVDKVVADLHEDLEKLLETWDKLSEDGSEEDEEEGEAINDFDSVKDYEDKFGKPFREEFVLSQRDNADDYENIDDSNLGEIFADHSIENVKGFVDDVPLENRSGKDNEGSNENTNNEETQDGEDWHEELDPMLVPLTSDKENLIFYQNDALVPETSQDKALEDLNDDIDDQSSDNIDKKMPLNSASVLVEDSNAEASTFKTLSVEDLNDDQYNELMEQFKKEHKEDLDTQSEDFSKHVAAVHMRLSVDEPLIVTSPNYPSPYPTNNIVDWIFDGKGMGIELNITDFHVNGLVGDFLLVKPGGVDSSGSEGLVFSYHLNSEHRYRFLDVDRMFVRFQSNIGMPFRTGFQFSVKLVSPLPEEAEPEPEPEPLLPTPPETLTVTLGGVTLLQFQELKEEFRLLIADMATKYIQDSDIEPGQNTTSEVTQITSTGLCNANWPNFESCAAVQFGIPIVWEGDSEGRTPRLTENDLRVMWDTYKQEDPFAYRLSQMGISEFLAPNDGHVLVVWVVIAAGVVISMAMLAFALWRFSCFEDYTRMAAFSDTDSLKNEKRNLDLYPTPHQTLPPLYHDADYKWADEKYDEATRVDMGGYANRSYIQDELFDIDSDDDGIAPRDRYTTDV